jgi:hypothetical protein
MEFDEPGLIHARRAEVSAGQHESKGQFPPAGPIEHQYFAFPEEVICDAGQRAHGTVFVWIHPGVIQAEPELTALDFLKASRDGGEIFRGVFNDIESCPFAGRIAVEPIRRDVHLPDVRIPGDQ